MIAGFKKGSYKWSTIAALLIFVVGCAALTDGKAEKEKTSAPELDEIVIEALVDDVSEIWLTSEGIYWKHITKFAKPGRHYGRNEPTLVNGKEWFPIWGMPKKERGIDTSKLYQLPVGALNFKAELSAVGKFRNAKGIERGSIGLRREKDAVVVTINDALPLGGSRWYRIRLYRTDEPLEVEKPVIVPDQRIVSKKSDTLPNIDHIKVKVYYTVILPELKSINSIVVGSVKSVNGVDSANIKSVN